MTATPSNDSVGAYELGPPPGPPPFGVIVDGRRVVLHGEFDIESRDDISLAVASVGDGAVLDMAGVTFIDSSGLRTILRATQRYQDVVVVRVSPKVQRLFEITGLDHVIAVSEAGEPS